MHRHLRTTVWCYSWQLLMEEQMAAYFGRSILENNDLECEFGAPLVQLRICRGEIFHRNGKLLINCLIRRRQAVHLVLRLATRVDLKTLQGRLLILLCRTDMLRTRSEMETMFKRYGEHDEMVRHRHDQITPAIAHARSIWKAWPLIWISSKGHMGPNKQTPSERYSLLMLFFYCWVQTPLMGSEISKFWNI